MSTQITIAAAMAAVAPGAGEALAQVRVWVGDLSGATSGGGCVAGAGVGWWVLRRALPDSGNAKTSPTAPAPMAPQTTAAPSPPRVSITRRPATQPPARQSTSSNKHPKGAYLATRPRARP